MTIPTLSESLNTEFTTTWYEIRPEAIDNILDSTVVTALLRAKGCFKTQSGGRYIERTIRYGEKTAFTFNKGDTLPVTEEELTTAALWNWAYMGVPITRSFVDDQVNAGPSKIRDYVQDRLTAAREGLVQKTEDIIMYDGLSSASSADDPHSLFDYIPDNSGSTVYFTSTTDTWGGVRRDNNWWQHRDYTDDVTVDLAAEPNLLDVKAGPYELTLLDDMNNIYNTTGNNREYPDIILSGQELFEAYGNFAIARDQIIKDEGTHVADLGYDVLRFRGKPFTWTSKMNYASLSSSYEMLMINSNYIDIVYDPAAWFDMTSWERPERQLEQVAYIVSAVQLVGYQPRANARAKWTA